MVPNKLITNTITAHTNHAQEIRYDFSFFFFYHNVLLYTNTGIVIATIHINVNNII